MSELSQLVVTKDNALVEASYTLGLVESRLILLAIAEARESGLKITPNAFLKIHADYYAKRFNVTRQAAYIAFSEAVQTLFNRQVTIYATDTATGLPKKTVFRWVSAVSYIEGAATVELRFSPEVIELISELEKNFTYYELSQIAHLQSAYAVRLYELLIKWRSVGKTPFILLSEFRTKLGVEGEYPRIFDLKKHVVDIAIKQINEHTDITASYEQVKKGRVITGLQFEFKEKNAPIKAKKRKAKAKGSLEDYIKKHARPGESLVQASARLRPLYEAGLTPQKTTQRTKNDNISV